MATGRDDRLGRTVGVYRLMHVLGAGATSTVYLGEQLDDPHTLVAIKVLTLSAALDPSERSSVQRRFLREAVAVTQLQHEHILPVLSYGETDGLNYIVMPLIAGGTLADRLEDAWGKLSLQEVARYLSQLASALDYAHERGIVHRDVKPSNVLIAKRDQIYLADFGIARLFDRGPDALTSLGVQESSGFTATGVVLGTLNYMAPEQIRAERDRPVGPPADIYALGVVAYELVIGHVPFRGETPLTVAMQHLVEEPFPPRDLRRELPAASNDAILRALAKEPDDRFATAGAFAEAFNAGLAVRVASSVSATPLAASPAATTPAPVAAAPVETTASSAPHSAPAAEPILEAAPAVEATPAVETPSAPVATDLRDLASTPARLEPANAPSTPETAAPPATAPPPPAPPAPPRTPWQRTLSEAFQRVMAALLAFFSALALRSRAFWQEVRRVLANGMTALAATASRVRARLSPRLVGIAVAVLLIVVAGGVGARYVFGGHTTATAKTGSGTPHPTPRPTARPTPRPTATPQPTATPIIVYQNPLTSPVSGWFDDGQHCFFGSGGYHVKGINRACLAPVGAQSNVDVTVQVTQINGSLGDQYGVEIRRDSSSSPANYYAFDINGSGQWYFYNCLAANPQCTLLVGQSASALHQGLNAINTLEVRAVGSHFTLWINKTAVGQADDSSTGSGIFAFEIGSADEVIFSQLTISQPPHP